MLRHVDSGVSLPTILMCTTKEGRESLKEEADAKKQQQALRSLGAHQKTDKKGLGL